MYALVIAFSGQLGNADNGWVALVVPGVWNTLLFVVAAYVIVDSVAKIRAGQTQDLATDGFAVKLVSIPFFLLNFVVLAALTFLGGAIIIFGGFVLLVAVWVGIGLTYLAMLSTSIYVWAAIARLRRDRVIGTGLAVLYTLLSFVFVTDIVAGVLVFGHSRRRPGLALVIVSLALGVVLIISGLLSNVIAGAVSPALSTDTTPAVDPLSIIGIVVIVGTIVLALVRVGVLRRRRAGTGVTQISE